jgi:putative hydrolase of the HAD superfamily
VATPRFIYFDLGNVLLTFDHEIAVRELAARTGYDQDRIRKSIFESGLQQRYECGEIDDDAFAAAFDAACPSELDTSEILRVCSDIFSLNVPIIPVIAHLHAAGHRLGILSNTCRAHWEFVAIGRFAALQRFFPVRILSFEVGCMKPGARIYESATAAAGVEPHEIFFTDDRPENVAGAREAGLDAEPFETVSGLIRQLAKRGVRFNI